MEEKLKKIMLILSSTRQSPRAVDYAIEKAIENNAEIEILFIIDVNIPDLVFEKMRETDLLPERQSKELYETILREYRQRGYALIENIEAQMKNKEISYSVFIERGDFAEEALKKIEEVLPDLVILTRSKKSKISRFIYGSSVDYLIRKSPCKIRIVEE
ncbi:MAG: universal stress protein [Candidatus Schekmanbacteria bacterium]|nr:MAG: universal stress protein [Candidatus Schekmanbacteria bacterium]